MIPFVRFCRSFFDSHAIFNLNLLGTEISNSVSIGMVDKAMRYSVLCNKQFKMGEISSLMQVDCFRLAMLPKNFNAIIFISYCLVFGIVFMALIVQYAFAAGFGVLIIISIINMIISRYTARYQKELANATDDRMKITTEVFNNIKFIKVNAWEEYFYDKLMSKRTKEVGWLRKKFLSESFATFSMWLAPKFILAATYGVYVATGGHL
jgi:ABC-type bacteriocin/lantibiotic exporter with double-glycine peptidase domain